MAPYKGTDYQHSQPDQLGILITNLGTPDAPTPRAVRRYLAEFLWDPRVVELPRPLWWLILHGFILPLRPRRAAHAYGKIWQEDGSPLLSIARRQAQALQALLTTRLGETPVVALGMRYGSPAIHTALETLRQAGVRRLLVVPLYPQYASSTTGATFDAVTRELQQWRWLPDLRFVSHYHDQPAYLEALVASIREARAHESGRRLLFSFHGLPRRTFLAGDPYHCHCLATARLTATRLGLEEGSWAVSFQSRFGREEWLRPYTDDTLRAWGEDGVNGVDVVCPGFSADCLETLEEIALQNRQIFLSAGGQDYRYIPALNDRPDHIAALADLVMAQLGGWPESRPDERAARLAYQADQTRRAVALGASR